jgi:hypothetical protein
MQKFVYWTGILGAFSGLGLLFPAISKLLMPSENPGLLPNLYGMLAVFLGIMLIFCSRDLRHRGTLVIWEGVLRVCVFLIIVWYGILGVSHILLVMAGVFDLFVGTIYLVALPRHLGLPLISLLLDRQAG